MQSPPPPPSASPSPAPLPPPAATPAAMCSSPGSTDLAAAAGASASASSDHLGSAGSAIDGNSGTRWESAFADPQWLVVDLGASYPLCTVRILWEGAYASAYTIDVSSDGTSWSTAASTGATGAGWKETALPEGTQGRYVRMYGTSRGTPYGYSIWTMSVYGSSASSASPPAVLLGSPPPPPASPRLAPLPPPSSRPSFSPTPSAETAFCLSSIGGDLAAEFGARRRWPTARCSSCSSSPRLRQAKKKASYGRK